MVRNANVPFIFEEVSDFVRCGVEPVNVEIKVLADKKEEPTLEITILGASGCLEQDKGPVDIFERRQRSLIGLYNLAFECDELVNWIRHSFAVRVMLHLRGGK